MRLGTCIVGMILVAVSGTRAAVERVEILSRSLVVEGRAFGDTGSYEKIAGRVHFKVQPGDPHNRIIVDLDKAPRATDGAVEFSADFYILRPTDLKKGNGTLLLEIPNRGNKN